MWVTKEKNNTENIQQCIIKLQETRNCQTEMAQDTQKICLGFIKKKKNSSLPKYPSLVRILSFPFKNDLSHLWQQDNNHHDGDTALTKKERGEIIKSAANKRILHEDIFFNWMKTQNIYTLCNRFSKWCLEQKTLAAVLSIKYLRLNFKSYINPRLSFLAEHLKKKNSSFVKREMLL